MLLLASPFPPPYYCPGGQTPDAGLREAIPAPAACSRGKAALHPHGRGRRGAGQARGVNGGRKPPPPLPRLPRSLLPPALPVTRFLRRTGTGRSERPRAAAPTPASGPSQPPCPAARAEPRPPPRGGTTTEPRRRGVPAGVRRRAAQLPAPSRANMPAVDKLLLEEALQDSPQVSGPLPGAKPGRGAQPCWRPLAPGRARSPRRCDAPEVAAVPIAGSGRGGGLPPREGRGAAVPPLRERGVSGRCGRARQQGGLPTGGETGQGDFGCRSRRGAREAVKRVNGTRVASGKGFGLPVGICQGKTGRVCSRGPPGKRAAPQRGVRRPGHSARSPHLPQRNPSFGIFLTLSCLGVRKGCPEEVRCVGEGQVGMARCPGFPRGP